MKQYVNFLIFWFMAFFIFFIIAPYFDFSGYYQEINFERIFFGIWYATLVGIPLYIAIKECHRILRRKEKTNLDNFKNHASYSTIFGSIGLSIFFISYMIFLLPTLISIIVTILGIIAIYLRRKAKKNGIITISSTISSFFCAFFGITTSISGIVYIWITSIS